MQNEWFGYKQNEREEQPTQIIACIHQNVTVWIDPKG